MIAITPTQDTNIAPGDILTLTLNVQAPEALVNYLSTIQNVTWHIASAEVTSEQQWGIQHSLQVKLLLESMAQPLQPMMPYVTHNYDHVDDEDLPDDDD